MKVQKPSKQLKSTLIVKQSIAEKSRDSLYDPPSDVSSIEEATRAQSEKSGRNSPSPALNTPKSSSSLTVPPVNVAPKTSMPSTPETEAEPAKPVVDVLPQKNVLKPTFHR